MAKVINKRIALFISPHLDDCCFSNFGTITYLKKLGYKIVCVNVFTRSKYTEYVINGDINTVRKNEDNRFCFELGIEAVYLNFKDSSLRGYTDDTERVNNNYIDEYQEDVHRELYKIINTISPQLVFLPLALGNHVDHIIVSNFSKYIEHNKCIFYEDLPYANEYSFFMIKQFINNKMNMAYVPLHIPFRKDVKKHFCLIYHSQIGKQTITDILEHSQKNCSNEHCETIWINRSKKLFRLSVNKE